MADYYTKLSIILPVPTDECREWIRATLTDPPEKMRNDLEPGDPIGFHWDLAEHLADRALWIWSDEGTDLERLAIFIQLYLQRDDTEDKFGFEFSYDCSKMRADAFGGGACFITKEQILFHFSHDWLNDQLSKGHPDD